MKTYAAAKLRIFYNEAHTQLSLTPQAYRDNSTLTAAKKQNEENKRETSSLIYANVSHNIMTHLSQSAGAWYELQPTAAHLRHVIGLNITQYSSSSSTLHSRGLITKKS